MFAMTIVGGRGERLKPYTDTLPKAMVPINGRPLIAYQIEWMRLNGVTDVVFLCGYMGEKIRDFVGNGSELGITAHYSVEQEPLGRGGAVRQGFEAVPEREAAVLVVNGDVLTDQPLAPVIKLHEAKKPLATMTLVAYPSQYGIVEAGDDGMVTSFREKPELPHWINAGIYLFDRSIETMLPEVGDHETETFPQLAEQRKLAAYKSSAFWMAVDSAKEMREAGERMAALAPSRRQGARA